MVAYSFQARFVGRIVAGLEPGPWLPGMKRHTLRRPRAGRQQHARPEQPVHLYTAMRTRQCRQVGMGTACVQIPVTLYWNGDRLLLGRREGRAPRSYTAQQAPIVQSLIESMVGSLLHGESMDEFARADGFEDAADMARFFEPPERAGMMDLVLIGWRPGYQRGGVRMAIGPGWATRWRKTGRVTIRRGWFGLAVLYVEEIHSVFLPVTSGHSPANWTQQTRWRRARMEDFQS